MSLLDHWLVSMERNNENSFNSNLVSDFLLLIEKEIFF